MSPPSDSARRCRIFRLVLLSSNTTTSCEDKAPPEGNELFAELQAPAPVHLPSCDSEKNTRKRNRLESLEESRPADRLCRLSCRFAPSRSQAIEFGSVFPEEPVALL